MALSSLSKVMLPGDATDPLEAVTLRQLPPAFTGTIVTSAMTQAAIGTATTLNAALTLHNLARTGSWADLLSKPTTIALSGAVTAAATALGSGAITVNATALAAANLTGTIPSAVLAVTQAAGTSNTTIATTAFVTSAISNISNFVTLNTTQTITANKTIATDRIWTWEGSTEGVGNRVVIGEDYSAIRIGDIAENNIRISGTDIRFDGTKRIYGTGFFGVATTTGDVIGNAGKFAILPNTTNSDNKIYGFKNQGLHEFLEPSSTIYTLVATNWIGASAPYTYNLTVPGLTTDTIGIFGISQTATNTQTEQYGLALIKVNAQSANTLPIVALGEKPSVDIPVEYLFLKY